MCVVFNLNTSQIVCCMLFIYSLDYSSVCELKSLCGTGKRGTARSFHNWHLVLFWFGFFLSQRVEQKQREFALKHERWQPSPPSFACKHVIPDIVNISHIVLGALSFRNETNTLGLQFALAASSRTFGMISSYLTCFHSWEEMTLGNCSCSFGI